MSSLRYYADYVSSSLSLVATVAETSASTAAASAQIAAHRGVAESSASALSTGTARASTISVAETSTSSDYALGLGPKDVWLPSLSILAVSVTRMTADQVAVTSLSSDTALGILGAFATATSLSSDTAVSSQTAGRTLRETSLSADHVTFAHRVITAAAAVTSTSHATTAIIRRAQAAEISSSSIAVVVHLVQRGFTLQIREKAPLQLSVDIQTPAGNHARWGIDDVNPSNVPGGLSLSTVMPGGYEQLSTVLARDPARDYPDLEELSTVTVYGAGKQTAGQFRLESSPDQSGDQMAITPGAVGWQSHLADDSSAREVFVDRDITQWQGPSVARQVEWLTLNPPFPVTASGPSVGPDFSTSYPSLVEELAGSWTASQVVEAWYDAHGIALGMLYAAWETNGQFVITGGNAFGAGMFLATDDTAFSYDTLEPLFGTPASASLTASTIRAWAMLQFYNDTVPGGKDGTNYDLYWTALGVYGAHGLPLYGSEDFQDAQGVLASDAVAYAINRWCPRLRYSTGAGGSIQPSSFVIPHLVFLDPVTTSAMITEAVKYELLDWAVWEGPTGDPTFYLNARGARGRTWRARTGPAQLQGAGPQVGRLFNGVVVQWSDVSGVNRTVGPPGAGCNFDDPSLVDTDPLNPVNQASIKKYALVTMGTSTQAGASQIGRMFLAEQALLDTSGQATHTGYVQDAASGIDWPVWMMRAGDYVTYTDARNTTPRRIVHTSYDDSTKANAIQLDQPPDSLDAIIQRLAVSLSPYGMS